MNRSAGSRCRKAVLQPSTQWLHSSAKWRSHTPPSMPLPTAKWVKHTEKGRIQSRQSLERKTFGRIPQPQQGASIKQERPCHDTPPRWRNRQRNRPLLHASFPAPVFSSWRTRTFGVNLSLDASAHGEHGRGFCGIIRAFAWATAVSPLDGVINCVALRMRVYLDNCCYNRPFDDQGQMRIRLETEAKLRVQALMRTGEIEYVSRDYTKWRESQFNEADEDIYSLAEKIKAYKPSRRRHAAHINP